MGGVVWKDLDPLGLNRRIYSTSSFQWKVINPSPLPYGDEMGYWCNSRII